MGTDLDVLARTLFSPNRRRLLAHLFGRADEKFYLRELVRATGGGLGAVQRELRALVAAGIVARTKRGNQVFFQADAACPIYAELKALIVKTCGAVGLLQQSLQSLSAKITVAFLFGSYAAGREHSGSDIDLMIVGNVTFSAVIDALSAAQEQLGRDINPVVCRCDEYRSRIAAGDPFLHNVLGGPKLFLVGGERELVGLAQERLAREARAQPHGDRRPAHRRRARPD